MLNHLLLNCRNKNGVQRIRMINKNLFTKKDDQQTHMKANKISFQKDEDINFKKMEKNKNTDPLCLTNFVHESGMTFADLFDSDCNFEDIKDIFDAIEYLIKASGADMAKIRRFYVTLVVLAIHSPDLDPNIRYGLRKDFQLTDETKWRENSFLNLCESYLLIQSEFSARYSMSFRVNAAKMKYFLKFKKFLLKALKAGIPKLEHWDLQKANYQVKNIHFLIENLKGRYLSILTLRKPKEITCTKNH